MEVERLRSMPHLVAECVRLHLRAKAQKFRREDAVELERLKVTIPPLLRFLSAAVCQTLPHQATVDIDDDQPGYVVFRVGDLRVFVPFFFANVFPHGEVLREICDLGARLQIGIDSVICISGSVCQLGLGVPVADLDFCEYLPAGDDRVPERLSQKLVELSPQAICFRLVLGEGNVWVRPWGEIASNADMATMTANLRKAMTTAAFRQCDFVASVPSLGVLEATNVFVLLDYSALESSEARRSFAAQEAPLAQDGWTPRELSSPLALGEYMAWLVDTACDLCDQSQVEPRAAVKAARRALAAVRLLFLRRETERLVCLLGDDAARLAALFDRCQLYSAISDITDEAVQEFKIKLRNSIGQLRRYPEVDDLTHYLRLSDEEANDLCGIRDSTVPVVRDVLESVKRLIGIDLTVTGRTH